MIAGVRYAAGEPDTLWAGLCVGAFMLLLTDTPLGSVKSNIARGSRRLRETLRDYRPTTEDARHGT